MPSFLNLKHYRIGTRLALGFATLTLLTLAAGLFAVNRMNATQASVRGVTHGAVPAVRELGSLATQLAEYRVSERGLVASQDNPDKVKEYTDELVAGSKAFYVGLDSYRARLADPGERALYDKVRGHADSYFANSRALVEGLKVGDLAPSKLAGDLRQATADAVAVLLEHKVKSLAVAVETQEAGHRTSVRAIIGLLLVAMIVAGLLSWLTTRSILRPLVQVVRAAQAVSRGDLTQSISVDDRSELGRLAVAMSEVMVTLRRLAEAQRALFEQHQAGQISDRMDASTFKGSFGTIASDMNELVDSHIQVKLRIIDVVSAYARGDLSPQIERFPGEKARVTTAIDAVKAGLESINGEIRGLVDAGMAGDFQHRGDASKFEFVYRDMIENLNALMQSADRGLGEVGAVFSAVAAGDLTQQADATLPGQFGQLAADANGTVRQLASIVGQIREGSESIRTAAVEISSGNNDLSQRTEQQAASLEETASSMEELTSTVRQTADNARQANQLANGAADVAAKGGDVVAQVVKTMSEINTSSKKVTDIISVIDGIAFQTNILALNAAVEAARAGEQGRGFAVVAAEVRSLAQRSANAAKEIKQLIADSTQKVEEGTALVDRAGKTMSEIVTSVTRVTDIIGDISAAAQEQSAGIEQVNQAILHMDEGTQQNATLVEEASAAARSLEQQSQQLVEMVAAFQLQDSDAAGRVANVEQVSNPSRSARVVAHVAGVSTLPSSKGKAAPAQRLRAAGGGAEAHWQEF